MDISEFLIRIIFLVLPGIVASRVYRALQGEARGKDWESFIEIALFSLLSYGLYGGAALLFGGRVTMFEALFDETIPLRWSEILVATGFSLPLAYLASLIHHKNLVNRLGQYLTVTERYGGMGVWKVFFSFKETQEWIFVRDHRLWLTYYGFVVAYNTSEEIKELILKDVEIYDSFTSKKLYNRQSLYLSRKPDDITIEVPHLPTTVSSTSIDQS